MQSYTVYLSIQMYSIKHNIHTIHTFHYTTRHTQYLTLILFTNQTLHVIYTYQVIREVILDEL